MKYLKIRISAQDRGVLYEKDVQVRDAFESFIRAEVSTLVQDGTMNEGEHYAAIIIPRYGDFLRRTPILLVDAAKIAEKTDWLEMRCEEPVQPEKRVTYFTIEFRIRERNLIYRQDFQTFQVGTYYINYGITQALIKLGVLKSGDYYLPDFFARDDDQAQFDREYIPALKKQAAALVELIPDVPTAVAFQYRDSAFYGKATTIGIVDADDIRIFLRQDAGERLAVEGKRSGEGETGGILVGQIYETTDRGRRIVEISDFIVSEHTSSSVVELRYTFQSWQASSAKLKQKFPGLRIVGWYHTHLVALPCYTDESHTQMEQTKLFFSRDDLFLHKQFFAEEWYVAMVLDTQGNSMFFQWKNKNVVPCGGYRIFEDIGVAGKAEKA